MATIKISALPAAVQGNIVDTSKLPLDDSGGTTVGATLSQLRIQIGNADFPLLGSLHQTVASAPNDVKYVALLSAVGADVTLGPLNLKIEVKPSATAGNRITILSSGDNVTFRPIEVDSPLWIGNNLTLMSGQPSVAGTGTDIVFGATTQTTIGAAGGATNLPVTPLGYLVAYKGTTKIGIPYYPG